MQLSPECARVLGALMEKGLATPQQYPLTVNALQSACNQTSNREPVVSYDETTVLAALDELKDQKLVRFVLPSHGRSVVRYRQVLDETLGPRRPPMRRPGRPPAPRPPDHRRAAHPDRAHGDASTALDEIQHELDLLHAREEPLAHNVGRRPGQKEERWATTLSSRTNRRRRRRLHRDAAPAGDVLDGDGRWRCGPWHAHDDELRAELAELRAEVADLRQEVHELRESLGG